MVMEVADAKLTLKIYIYRTDEANINGACTFLNELCTTHYY